MNGIELESVIDKLADKLGATVDGLMPVATEVLEQYTARAGVFVVLLSVFSVVFVVASVYFGKKAIDLWEKTNIKIPIEPAVDGYRDYKYAATEGLAGSITAVCVLCIIGFGVSFGLLWPNVSSLIAPLPSILGL